MLKFERRGWITLPPRRRTPLSRTRPAPQPPEQALPVLALPRRASLSALLPLASTETSPLPVPGDRAIFAVFLRQSQYLSHTSWAGQNLRYLVRDHHGQPLVCGFLGAAA